MIINSDVKDLILEYVGRYFKYENDFYRLPSIKFTDANWQRFKSGETSIEKMGAARVMAMLDHLFADFELTMIGKAQDDYYLNNSLKMNMTFPAYYDQFKKRQLLDWLKNKREDIVSGSGRIYTADGNWISSAYLGIALKSSMLEEGEYHLIQMRFKNYSKDPRPIPAGKQNRLTWIENNLENIR